GGRAAPGEEQRQRQGPEGARHRAGAKAAEKVRRSLAGSGARPVRPRIFAARSPSPPPMRNPASRRTKIVCTLGPATSSREAIRALIEAGMDVARLNFSHGSHDDHRRLIELVREEAQRAGRVVPVLQDLQGPKIRIGEVKNGVVLLHKGQPLTLTAEPVRLGTRKCVHVSYEPLAEEVSEGGR